MYTYNKICFNNFDCIFLLKNIVSFPAKSKFTTESLNTIDEEQLNVHVSSSHVNFKLNIGSVNSLLTNKVNSEITNNTITFAYTKQNDFAVGMYALACISFILKFI